MINKISIKFRRILALIVDIIFVVAIGAVFGLILRPWLLGLGHKAYLIGFSTALFYHGITNSNLMAGQSPGKIIFRLKVVSKTGNTINPLRSLLRSFLIVICFFGEAINMPDIWNEVLTYVMTPFAFALIYFAIFTRCNRSIHDYVCGTYVVESDTKEFYKCTISFKHLVIVIILSIILLFGRFFLSFNNDVDRNFAESLKKTHAIIMTMSNVIDAKIQLEDNKFIIGIQTIESPVESHNLSVKATCTLIDNLKISNTTQTIQTIIMRGYDLKIYRSWEVYDNTLTVKDWLIECNKLSNEKLR